jgi:hypothetical protein
MCLFVLTWPGERNKSTVTHTEKMDDVGGDKKKYISALPLHEAERTNR